MEACKKIGELLLTLREKNPLVHHITNYVTANDCANITLAIGGSPVMADELSEVGEMTSMSSALVINLGTLNMQKLEAMLTAAKKANELNIPVILDPVGVGATTFRMEAAKRISDEIRLSVIRGNLSEIKVLCGINIKPKGVDASEILGAAEAGEVEAASIAKTLASKLSACIAITGEVDLITDGTTIFRVENGNRMMSRVTGTGCMCTSLIGSYLGTGATGLLAALAGIASMGIAGDIACERLDIAGGPGSLKVFLIDAIYKLDMQKIMERGRVYEA